MIERLRHIVLPDGAPNAQFGLCTFLAAVAMSAVMACKPPERAVQPVTITSPSIGAEMVVIRAGRFHMGSVAGNEDEQPEHEVRIHSMLMDRTEITQEQYDKLALGNPSHFKGPRLPVEQISWAEAASYCNLRSKAEGLEPCYDEQTAMCNFAASGYRLPTEAEWEYACRAGSGADFCFGRDVRSLKDYGWYAENSGKRTHPVGEKRPNAWGLYDMHGNVAEWCNDPYSEKYYAESATEDPRGPDEGERFVLRGGAWNCRADQCHSASRAAEDPGFQDACFARDAIGFRCVRRVPLAQQPAKQ